MTIETYYPPNYTIKKYKPRALTAQQLAFCEAYLAGESAQKSAILAGYNSPDRAASYLLRTKRIKDYLHKQQSRVVSAPITIEYKLDKLKTVVDQFIPDSDLKVNEVKVGISAIAELNRMQGHYAPDKSMNLNVNADAQATKELIERLESEHKSEY